MSAEVPRFAVADRAELKGSFSDRLAQLINRIDFRRADSAKERDAIFRLRYQAYIREGTISPNSGRMFSDPFDETGNVHLFGLYIDNELASSMRLHIASKEHPKFPSLEVFSDFLQPELNSGKVMVDATRFVADETLSRLYRGLPYATCRLSMLAGVHFKADHLLAAVRAEHQTFYRRAFNHRLICGPRPYPHLAKPICLMTLHFPPAIEQLLRRYPSYQSTECERRMLFERSARLTCRESPLSPENVGAFIQRDPARIG